MREPLPLATIHDAVLEFLRDRKDAVLCGSQAVNAYVNEARMTEDVDLVSTRAFELAKELQDYLDKRFHIAVGLRDVREGLGYRICQVRKPKNRHLVDVRPVDSFPPTQRVKKVLVVSPPELIANKVMSMVARQHKPKSFTDKADLYRLLITFPKLKAERGPVVERLQAADADAEVMAAWKEIVAQQIEPEDEDDKFGGDQ